MPAVQVPLPLPESRLSPTAKLEVEVAPTPDICVGAAKVAIRPPNPVLRRREPKPLTHATGWS